MKKIKLLGLIVCIALIYLIFIGTSNNEDNNESSQNESESNGRVDVQKENVEEVVNNGGSVLKYNGYLYYVSSTNTDENGFNNKLCRRQLENDTEEILYDAERYKISDRLIIFNNNLFFSMVGQTYYINLDNTNYIDEYNKGILYTIGDGKLIYAYNNNLFKATYYLKTLAINSISSIATLNPNFMFEDNKNLYFYSDNSDNSKSIVSVNKEKQTVKVLDRIYLGENSKLNIIDFKESKNYIYLILEKDEYEIRRIAKDGEKVELANINSKPSEIVYTIEDNLYYKLNNYSTLYEYNEKENKILEVESTLNSPSVYYLKLTGKNISLYKNESEIITILRDVEKVLNNVSIEEIEETLYIRFDLNVGEQREIMFWKVNKDGSNLERINNI